MILILILIIATILRLYDLTNLPIALFGDEVDVGYHALSLWTTGHDYMGNFLPTYIQSLSEWRTPLLSYLIAPFVGILGPSTFSVRLAPALLGVLNIYLTYLLANQLFSGNKYKILNIKYSMGKIAALLLALTPWHIHFSRLAIDATLLLSLYLLAVYLFLTKNIYCQPFFLFLLFTLMLLPISSPHFYLPAFI